MIKSPIIETLKVMRLSSMAQGLECQLADSAYNALGFEERLGLLVDAEWNQRQSTKLKRYLNSAKFAIPAQVLKELSITKTESLIKPRFYGFLPVSMLMKVTTSYSRGCPATARLT